jgi:hypothetical protein
MKAARALLLAVAFVAAPIAGSPADSDRTLQNVKGTVTYGAQNPGANKLALHARATLGDNDFANTQGNSQATITLPDSSQIVLGSNSSVQMVQFQTSDITHAKFVVVGKMRFAVNHPQGARADYQFQTPTGQIAVRGTVGDIFSSPQGLQVNVYSVSNPELPVQVTLANGQVFTLAAGQSLVATAAAGAVTASVTSVSQSMFSPFSELGAPANASSLGISAGAGAAGASGAAITTAAAAVGTAAAVGAVTASNTSKTAPSPSPTPSPAPTGTSVPVTVSGVHRGPGGTVPFPHPTHQP